MSVCVSVCADAYVCALLVRGGALTWQSAAFLLGGDVMRTSSPLADREPCLCSPPEEKPHCVPECMRVCVCVSLSDCDIGSWGRWGSQEALDRVYFPLPLREREPLTDAFLSNIPEKKEVSHVLQSTVAAQPDCAAVSDCPLLPNSPLREAKFFAVQQHTLGQLMTTMPHAETNLITLTLHCNTQYCIGLDVHKCVGLHLLGAC